MNVNLLRSAIAMTCVATCLVFAGTLMASGATGITPEELAQLDLAQLAQVKIVSVDKRAEPLADAAAAVRVVSSEDIARSGATSIPEALRTVPGLNVAQINGPTCAIGARGFQSEYAAKLLVMEDGVSVYTPLFSGVFWDQQNYFLPDIDQMEVMLGPGGSIWGANAMNGVINVITKSARDTQGGLLYAGSGNEKLAMTGARAMAGRWTPTPLPASTPNIITTTRRAPRMAAAMLMTPRVSVRRVSGWTAIRRKARNGR